MCLEADVSNSGFSCMFEAAFPGRFFNVGIAEPALVDVAAGPAKSGRAPIANTFAFLFAARALEMARTHLCLEGANVKLGGAAAECLSEAHPVPIQRVSIAGRFAEGGPSLDLLEKCGLSVEAIIAAVRRAVGRKQ